MEITNKMQNESLKQYLIWNDFEINEEKWMQTHWWIFDAKEVTLLTIDVAAQLKDYNQSIGLESN